MTFDNVDEGLVWADVPYILEVVAPSEWDSKDAVPATAVTVEGKDALSLQFSLTTEVGLWGEETLACFSLWLGRREGGFIRGR
jgi:hypothetical protein